MLQTPQYRDFTSREFQKVVEVAKFGRIGRPQVDKAIQSGELPARRFGRNIRIRTADALRWLGIPAEPEAEQGQEPAEGQK